MGDIKLIIQALIDVALDCISTRGIGTLHAHEGIFSVFTGHSAMPDNARNAQQSGRVIIKKSDGVISHRII